jgi:exodeoxyribonuclease V alpha subunit
MMHDVIINSEYNQDLILKLNGYGFSVNDAIKLISLYKGGIEEIIENNVYELLDYIPFDKLDTIFLKNNNEMHPYRIEALLLHNIYTSCFESGDTLVKREELFLKLKKCFKGNFSADIYLSYIDKLINENKIVMINDLLSLKNFVDTEKYIYSEIVRLSKVKNIFNDSKIDKYINKYEKRCSIIFNEGQKEAIKGAIKNNFFIISGGPGTGKTTIIKAIVEILKDLYDLNSDNFALLAPTGRASKRLSESVKTPAWTIHKYLKWNKETENFLIDEYNKSNEDIVIVDESSMIDIFLFSSLLKGLKNNVKLILVGDANQLPSIGPGDILNDLLMNNNFSKKYLDIIYRVKDGSYITYLANDIKNKVNFDKFSSEYTDFKFLESNDNDIQSYLKRICETIKDKKISLNDFQVLIPMYKGINGIDNINNLMANIFNPNQDVFQIGDKYYRVNDKVIQLVNDIDNNIYNGDIGYIQSMEYVDKKLVVEINYSGNVVEYKSGEFDKFNLAYAVSIHKSQGSEYDNVVVVLAKSFNRMFYNKLIYTAVTRAKSSLVILGSLDSFNMSVKTLYGDNRNTYLKGV